MALWGLSALLGTARPHSAPTTGKRLSHSLGYWSGLRLGALGTVRRVRPAPQAPCSRLPPRAMVWGQPGATGPRWRDPGILVLKVPVCTSVSSAMNIGFIPGADVD